MSTAETLQLVSLVFVAVSVTLVMFQTRSVAKSLGLNAVVTRHQMYLTLTEAVTPEMVETMELHLSDHITLAKYNESYRDNERRFQSYALMKRKYLYLYFLHMISDRKYSPESQEIAETWIKELSRFQEFRDVHECQKQYYGKYAQFVDDNLDPQGVRGWMVDESPLAPFEPGARDI